MANSELLNILKKEKILPLNKERLNQNIESGFPLSKSKPYFIMTDMCNKQAREIAFRMRLGENEPALKSIGWYGPPGTGKNSLAREIAVCLNMPYLEFDLGYGTDLLELIGGTGLVAPGGATITTAVEGPITKAAKIGAIICINEVVNVEGIQMSVLHSMVQDRIISLPSAETQKVISVHPNTFFVFTWNPDLRNPDRQMPPPALLDRIRARKFDADNSDDEVKKLHSFLKNVFAKHVNIEAIKKDVKLIRELREAYQNGHLARCPYMRTLQDFSLTRISQDEKAAFSVLLNLCDQDPQEFTHQKNEIIKRHFEPIFGPGE
jgi:hypothetical protein